MCRWIAYLGTPVRIDAVLTRPDHSLIDQSMLARQRYAPGSGHDGFSARDLPTNGDGFGLAWAGDRGVPGQYRDTRPAWNDANLHRLTGQLHSGCFLSHVRAASSGAVSRSNCHPFVHGRWMFQHNGGIGGFATIKRELVLDVDPVLYPLIEGSTDSEVCFFLALTYGLADDPVRAMARMVARVERARAGAGIPAPFSATMAAADGEELVVLRHVSPGAGYPSPTLYHSIGPETLHVRSGATETLPRDAQLVVSEPLELHYSRRRWAQVPDDSITVLRRGQAPRSIPLGRVAEATATSG